jgi:hypothetical protein
MANPYESPSVCAIPVKTGASSRYRGWILAIFTAFALSSLFNYLALAIGFFGLSIWPSVSCIWLSVQLFIPPLMTAIPLTIIATTFCDLQRLRRTWRALIVLTLPVAVPPLLVVVALHLSRDSILQSPVAYGALMMAIQWLSWVITWRILLSNSIILASIALLNSTFGMAAGIYYVLMLET